MGALDGRVAVITGAGRGIGREHALLFAAEGARVVVNDLGGAPDGSAPDGSAPDGSGPGGSGGAADPAQEVVAEIRAAGGEAVANADDVTTADGSAALVRAALDAFGDLHVLVNNAGILRDRMIVSMPDADWDSVIQVHLRGHFLPTQQAARYWRERSKAGADVKASVINTSSTSGLFGNVGQANYGAAKAGIAALTIIADAELSRYGVRCNAVAPVARTRLTQDAMPAPARGGFDAYDPANISPFVAYLATATCPIAGKVFLLKGGQIQLFQPWKLVDEIRTDHRWTVAELAESAAAFANVKFDLGRWY